MSNALIVLAVAFAASASAVVVTTGRALQPPAPVVASASRTDAACRTDRCVATSQAPPCGGSSSHQF